MKHLHSKNDEYIIDAEGYGTNSEGFTTKRHYKIKLMAKEGINAKVIEIWEDT